MKKLILSLLVVASAGLFAGEGDKIPASTVKKLDGTKVNSNTFTNNGKPIIISFLGHLVQTLQKGAGPQLLKTTRNG